MPVNKEKVNELKKKKAQTISTHEDRKQEKEAFENPPIDTVETDAGKSLDDFLSGYRATKSEHKSKESSESGVMSVIYSDNGKRITFPVDFCEELGVEDKLQIAIGSDTILVGQELPSNEIYYSLKKQGRKKIIYSAKLVGELVEAFNLDYSDGSVSKTFSQVEHKSFDELKVAVIKIQ
ncbi:protein of unknown function [Acetoanaerobium sticklandii]|uniref:Uncharacterized protein n=1 Tax=Acetoanaerobium sticklandii (strain ATCC 12662 / DSM 519 / JCM 1433 / CCUG 9281 / NCIMB 10654 / HF) TaxID=499177 RepID=E3PVT1_ACESD|nr:hypothetical protein [Acetoanaerobium sticklandii]CBH22634.1 protein of unknown function [Acetoanaerobium sticklandii]